jgi:hypothetical protein
MHYGTFVRLLEMEASLLHLICEEYFDVFDIDFIQDSILREFINQLLRSLSEESGSICLTIPIHHKQERACIHV